METSTDNVLPDVQPEAQTPASPVVTVSPSGESSPVADTAMATGTDNEPEMTIADKHAGEELPDPNGDGKLTPDEAAKLLGDNAKQ